MPVKPTYPGVYIEEVPSGVRTITGVSTSVAAFVGKAKRGPINEPVRIYSFGDYERRFGGLDTNSEMSYAIRQFFMNGGSEAWAVRVVKSAKPAEKTLYYGAGVDDKAIQLTASDAGTAGNNILVEVDYKTSNPASTFNLTLNYVSRDDPSKNVTEWFENLSMNSQDARDVETVVEGSMLVVAERVADMTTVVGNGTSVSGPLVNDDGSPADVVDLLDEHHRQFRVSINGSAPIVVALNPSTDVLSPDDTPEKNLELMCSKIKDQVLAYGRPEVISFECAATVDMTIVMTSGIGGENSSVRVLPGPSNDASARLKLGTVNGGVETDAVAEKRPVETPDHGRLRSGNLVAEANLIDYLNSPDAKEFQIGLDGNGPDVVRITDTGPIASLDPGERLGIVAKNIETAVRTLKPNKPAYKEFTCVYDAGTNAVGDATGFLEFASGSRGSGSRVFVAPVEGNNAADKLLLLQSSSNGVDAPLEDGEESNFETEAEAYKAFFGGSRNKREGVYALESVDHFNLLCLPGQTNGGLLSDAASYCVERRAFLIADAPPAPLVKQPDDMVNIITGTSLPKTENGAVYYPWIKIGDPLKGGALRTSAPCGAIAGVYARTDSTRGVWKAPAGIEATVVGAQDVGYRLTDMETGSLNQLGANCIRVLPVHGTVSWGGRTLLGADEMASEWKYIPVRRLALHIEESLFRGTKWVVFEPNDEPLWAQIRLNVGAFMQGLFRQGAFQGSSPKDAYLVKCDKETTTQNDINSGVVNILVGFAPLKPAEFVFIKIQQLAGQTQA